jgi:GNAT superfamily N-acetyltransferase
MRDEDFPAIARLLGSSFGQGEHLASEAYLRWQYRQNPLGETITYVAESFEGEVVGTFSVTPHPYGIDGKKAPGLNAINLAADPRFRNQGIWRTLGQCAFEEGARRGFVGVIAFPNPNSLHGFTKTHAFHMVGLLEAFARPRHVGTMLARGRKVTPAHALLDRVSERWFALRTPATARHEASAESLVDLLPRKTPFTLQPHRDWLRYRFGECPLWKYDCVRAPAGEPEAAVVSRHAKLHGLRTTLMMDFGARWDDPRGVDSLVATLRAVCRRAVEENSDHVMTLVSPGHPARPALKRAGFIHVPDRFLPHPGHVVYLPLGGHPVPENYPAWAISVSAWDAA